jgi:RNase P/RNase MRP subunit POP5
VKYFNPKTNMMIVKIPFEGQQMFTLAIENVKPSSIFPCELEILHVSGTILKIQEKCVEKNIERVKKHNLKNVTTEVKIDGF